MLKQADAVKREQEEKKLNLDRKYVSKDLENGFPSSNDCSPLNNHFVYFTIIVKSYVHRYYGVWGRCYEVGCSNCARGYDASNSGDCFGDGD